MSAQLRFHNRWLRELPGDPEPHNSVRQVHGAAWSHAPATAVARPVLLAHSPEMARALGLDARALASPEWVNTLAGNRLMPGMQHYATAYGGHQFGQWAGQLGDGRAIFLGEALGVDGQRWEIQLKGAGATPYSRHADGRAVLRSSVREFLCSEAMHYLGVPTTRALSLVATGETIMRDMFYDGNPRAEPGAIVCRLAPSFVRFGHLELPSARGDIALLRQLVNFTIDRDFPQIDGDDEASRIARWFAEVCARTGELIACWMSVGFVHGVMNTDNMSVLGLTIDYGPYGWLEDFDPGWTPNTTDAEGRRYCFGRQPDIARWNLERLARTLRPLCSSDERLADGLQAYAERYGAVTTERFAAKLGFPAWHAAHAPVLERLFELLFHSEVDMTDFFRRLGEVDPDTEPATALACLAESSYAPARWARQADGWRDWWQGYTAAAVPQVDAGETALAAGMARRTRMQAANPRYVLRNWLAQQAIEQAEAGDASGIEELLALLRQPYTVQPGRERYAQKRPDWARHKAGCSALSCSS